jgi:hypothetical protein
MAQDAPDVFVALIARIQCRPSERDQLGCALDHDPLLVKLVAQHLLGLGLRDKQPVLRSALRAGQGHLADQLACFVDGSRRYPVSAPEQLLVTSASSQQLNGGPEAPQARSDIQ